MTRVLVTGAAGFIGSHVAERLVARGDEVIGLDNFDDFYPRAVKQANLAALAQQPRFRLVEGDIRDAALVGRLLDAATVTVHLAARAGVRPSLEEPARYASVNIEGTAVLLEAARKAGAHRFVFGSSSSVYGDTAPVPFAEDWPALQPISPYAATKRACELVAHTFHHAHGMEITCARIFTAYGPRQRPDLAIRKFAERMLRGDAVPVYGDGSALRDFTYVGDLVEGLLRALDTDLGFAILNFGAGRTVSVLDVIRLLEKELGVSARIDWQPRQTGDVSRTWADISAARAALGYAPATSLEDGIARFAEWLRNPL